MQAARFGVGQQQALARARDADIGEAALLFEATGFFDRLLARKQAVFEADQEHERELQPLRRMQRHQLHAILPGLALAFAGFERRVRKKGGQFRKARFEVVGRAPKAARHVDELVEVLDARLGAAATVLLVEIAQSGARHRAFDLLGEREWFVGLSSFLLVIPENAGLRRQDAGANIGRADGPKGRPLERPVIQFLAAQRRWLPAFAGTTR